MLINVEWGSLMTAKCCTQRVCIQHCILWPTLLLTNTKKCWMMLKTNLMEIKVCSTRFDMVAKQVQHVELNNVGWCWTQMFGQVFRWLQCALIRWCLCWSMVVVFEKVLGCLLFTYFLTYLINRNWVKIWQENEGTKRGTGTEKENWNSWNWRGLPVDKYHQ